MQLPTELRVKIEALIGDAGRHDLADAAREVSEKYRRLVKGNLQIESDEQAKAYLATRLPATFAVIHEVATGLNNIWSNMNPQTVMDLGAGPGTATLVLQTIWPDIASTLVEQNSYLAKLGKDLFPTGSWQHRSLQTYEPAAHDITIASYVFNEVEDFENLLGRFWQKTGKAFILIEPGTPQGYEVVLKARDYFLNAGGFIAAPCPHHFTCPLVNSGRWCHFSKRVARSQLHRAVKEDAFLPYEDEKFSYLVVTRETFERPLFRVLGHPHGEKLVSLETCQRNGAFEILQTSRRDADFKRIKKMDWGDAFF